jgi:hypothetical protein
MKKLFFAFIVAIGLSSCIDEIINPEPDYLSENYDLAILDEVEVSDQFYEDISLVLEALDHVKSVDSAQAPDAYLDYLKEQGADVSGVSPISYDSLTLQNIYNSTEFSDEFKAFATEFEKIITTMEGYNDFSSQLVSGSALMKTVSDILDATESELARQTLLSTDLLFQHRMQKALENGRIKIDWGCVGAIGLGTISGCRFGLIGCVFGAGLGALTC